MPSIKLARFLNLGFGAGPIGVIMPHQKNYFTQADSTHIGKDSLQIMSKKPKPPLSFGIGAFMDLNYQITPVTSIGTGIGAGVKISDNLDGNLYIGVNLGFRVKSQVLIALRGGVAFEKSDVLIDNLDEGKVYATSAIPTTGITTKAWQVGGYFGITASYLTKAIK